MMETFNRIMSMIMALFMSFLASVGLAAPRTGSTVNFAYGSDPAQVMDIYMPSGAKDKASNAALLLLHDGLFESGSKSSLKDTCESIASHGYIACALDYRLLSQKNKTVTIYSILDDLTLAIRALKDFSAENKLNINKIALAGDSAGGYYALMYSYSRIIQSPLQLCFTAARVAPSDMTYDRWKGFYTDEQYINLVNLMAGTSYTAGDITAKANDVNRTALYLSPVYYLNRSSLPTLYAYAYKDTVIPLSNKDSLESALTNCGVKHDSIEYTSATHDLGNIFNTLLKTADFSDQLVKYCNAYFG